MGNGPIFVWFTPFNVDEAMGFDISGGLEGFEVVHSEYIWRIEGDNSVGGRGQVEHNTEDGFEGDDGGRKGG